MPSAAITVENLSKAYRIGLKDEIPDTLVSAVTNVVRAPWKNFQRLRRLNTFTTPSPPSPNSELRTPISDTLWALRDVSFEVKEGEVVGIIGRNGAGKSTLLKILSRITEPTSGRVVIRGRVSSLLEVGTGFHPELTGRENVYMNGTILGMKKREIDRKFHEIVDFAGVARFLDTPVKRYSSGMKVRLAFAVAAHLEPEILIVDEVLAVGDAEFQTKCLGKMENVAQSGKTVLFVSHNLGAISSLCTHAFLLKNGLIDFRGTPQDTIAKYFQSHTPRVRSNIDLAVHKGRSESSQAIFQRLRLLRKDGHECDRFGSGDTIRFSLDVAPLDIPDEIIVHIAVADSSGQRLFTLGNDLSGLQIHACANSSTIICDAEDTPLMPGTYHVILGLALRKGRQWLDTIDNVTSFDIETASEPYSHVRSKSLGPLMISSIWMHRSSC